MSVVFECVMVPAPKNAVAAHLHAILDLIQQHVIEVEEVNGFSVIYWDYFRRREFGDFGVQLCAVLSRLFRQAVLVRYDSGTCYRFSALFTNGVEERLFQLADEKWVLIDGEGRPDPSQGVFFTHEMLKEREYETTENAVQLGLKQIGFEDWRRLLALMADR